MKRRLLALIMLALFATDASAGSAYRITFDLGGDIDVYVEKYTAIRLVGGSVIIDGPCLSACTLVTGLPADRICITPRAFLGFHSASQLNPRTGQERFAQTYTNIMWLIFPKRLREIVVEHGWDGQSEHADFVYVEADELRSIFRACDDE